MPYTESGLFYTIDADGAVLFEFDGKIRARGITMESATGLGGGVRGPSVQSIEWKRAADGVVAASINAADNGGGLWNRLDLHARGSDGSANGGTWVGIHGANDTWDAQEGVYISVDGWGRTLFTGLRTSHFVNWEQWVNIATRGWYIWGSDYGSGWPPSRWRIWREAYDRGLCHYQLMFNTDGASVPNGFRQEVMYMPRPIYNTMLNTCYTAAGIDARFDVAASDNQGFSDAIPLCFLRRVSGGSTGSWNYLEGIYECQLLQATT